MPVQLVEMDPSAEPTTFSTKPPETVEVLPPTIALSPTQDQQLVGELGVASNPDQKNDPRSQLGSKDTFAHGMNVPPSPAKKKRRGLPLVDYLRALPSGTFKARRALGLRELGGATCKEPLTSAEVIQDACRAPAKPSETMQALEVPRKTPTAVTQAPAPDVSPDRLLLPSSSAQRSKAGAVEGDNSHASSVTIRPRPC